MTYTESFLSACDAEGNAPEWAIKQIFEDHNSELSDYNETHKGYGRENAESILDWLGY